MVDFPERRKKKSDRKATLFIRDMDRDVKAQFKAWCAERDLTMHDVIEKFMKETVKRDRVR
jgi:hypothetical protein